MGNTCLARVCHLPRDLQPEALVIGEKLFDRGCTEPGDGLPYNYISSVLPSGTFDGLSSSPAQDSRHKFP